MEELESRRDARSLAGCCTDNDKQHDRHTSIATRYKSALNPELAVQEYSARAGGD